MRLHLAKHGIDRIQGLQDDIHHPSIHLQFAIAQQIKKVLGGMTDFHQGVELEKASAALDRVEAAENGIQERLVSRIVFQFDELL